MNKISDMSSKTLIPSIFSACFILTDKISTASIKSKAEIGTSLTYPLCIVNSLEIFFIQNIGSL